MFTTAAHAVAADDPTRALELAVAAALLSTYGADSGATVDLTALATEAATGDPARTRCLGHLLLNLTRASAHDWAPSLASLHAALLAGTAVSDLDVLAHLGNAALHLGDDEAHGRCFTHMLAAARDAGAYMLVLYALPRLGFTQLVTGQWTALRSSAEEALSLSVSTRQRAHSAQSRSACSRCSPPSRADPASTTRCWPTSTLLPYNRWVCWPSPCTTSCARRKAPAPRTTATLRNIFTKAGVTSRGELAQLDLS